MTLHELILEPMSYEFMRRAMAISLIVGTSCALFSCFLVLKGWSLMGDAIAHAVLPGIILAYLTGVPIILGAFAGGLSCAMLTGFIKERCRVKEDAVMGIIFSGMFAAGLVMMTKIETELHVLHVLFGNVLGSSWGDVVQSGVLTALCFVLFAFKGRDLMLYCFDPQQARVSGLPIRALHFGLLIALALTIVAALQAVGIILVIAMLIAPGAIGFLLSQSFGKMVAIAIAVSILSCAFGTLASFHLDVATGPLIVTIQAGVFMVALGYTIFKNSKKERLA